MDTKEITKKILAMVGASAILIGSSFAVSQLGVTSKAENQKPYEYVLRDYENFNVDTYIVDLYNKAQFRDKHIRLKMDEDRPVVVDCKGNMDEEEKEIIEKVVNYYNDIFKTINENYKFVIKDDNIDVDKDDTVIYIYNASILGTAKGVYGKSSTVGDKENGLFVSKAQILVDWDNIKEMNDEALAYYVFFHEFGHALGLGDVYARGNHKNTDVLDMNTVMQVENDFNSHLYPNDYAILQALYSNEYTKHNNYYDAVKVVNNKIEKYTEYFYKCYAEFLKSEFNVIENMDMNKISSKLSWNGGYKSSVDLKYELELRDDNTCLFTITNKKTGEILEQSVGETVIIDGVMFIRGLIINDASNYNEDFEKGNKIKLMFNVFVAESVIKGKNHIVVNDATNFNNYVWKYQKEVSKSK